MNIYIVVGALLIIFAIIDLFRRETSSVGLSDFIWGWFVEGLMDFLDIKRESMAGLYWTILIVQFIVGLGFVVYGMNDA